MRSVVVCLFLSTALLVHASAIPITIMLEPQPVTPAVALDVETDAPAEVMPPAAAIELSNGGSGTKEEGVVDTEIILPHIKKRVVGGEKRQPQGRAVSPKKKKKRVLRGVPKKRRARWGF